MKKLKLTKQKLRELFKSKSFIDFVLHEDPLSTLETVQWLEAEYLMSFDKDFLNDFKEVERLGRQAGYIIQNGAWLDIKIQEFEKSNKKRK